MPNVDEFLEHFGVKGMRWGVRKDPDRSPNSSKALVKDAKTNYGKLIDAAFETRFNQAFGIDTVIDPTKLSNRDRTIRAGREFYRTTKTKNKDYFDEPYVSTNASDRKTYRGVMANLTGLTAAKRSYSSTYEMVLKSTKDFKLPSERARFDAFVDLMDSPVVILRNGKTITGKEYLKRTGHRDSVKKMDSLTIAANLYQGFVSTQGQNNPLNKAYFQAMRDLGYDALSDDNDRNIVSRDPLILLNAKSATEVVSVRRLTNDEINTALATLKVPPKLAEKVVHDLFDMSTSVSDLQHEYDAAKAREYYLRTRELKDRRAGGASYEVSTTAKVAAANAAAKKNTVAVPKTSSHQTKVEKLKARLERLKALLEKLVAQAKERSGVEDDKKETSDSKSDSSDSKPKTAAEKKKAAKEQAERRKKDSKSKPKSETKELEAQIKQVREKIAKMRKQIAAAKKRKSTPKTASKGR